jgi:hypothetical protein
VPQTVELHQTWNLNLTLMHPFTVL